MEEIEALSGFPFAYPIPENWRHVREVIPANGEEVIWHIDLTDSDVLMYPRFILLVNAFTITLGANSTLSWATDLRNQVEPMRSSTWDISSTLGSMQTPLRLEPGIVIVRGSTMTVTNTGGQSENVELFVWGGFLKKSLYRKLENLLLED